MIEFVNTLDQMSAEEAEDAVLEGTLTELEDIRFSSAKLQGFTEITKINMPLMTNPVIGDNQKVTEAKFFGANSFMGQNCFVLETIHLPNVKGLGQSDLYQCYVLNTLILSNKHVVTGLSAIRGIQSTPIRNGTGFVYVPKKLVEQYKVATNWSTVADQFRAIEDYPEIKALVDADLAEMRGETT